MLKQLLFLVGILSSSLVMAAPAPSEVKSVIEHYYAGSKPILFDVKLCTGVNKMGPEKHSCKQELDPLNIPQGSDVFVWMAYLVPKDAAPFIVMQANYKGRPMKELPIKLSESLRYRTWNSVFLNHLGDWELLILLETENGLSELKKIRVKVVDNAL